MGVTGRIRYYSSGLPVDAVAVHLDGPAPTRLQTDGSGMLSFTELEAATWQIEPRKDGDLGTAIGSLDAVYVLQSVVGLHTLNPEQELACDVTGNGMLSALDASLILQHRVGLISTFPVSQICGSDWAFIPVPAPALNQNVIAPQVGPGTCRRGAIAFEPLMSQANGQDFSAVLFGDCTGNWQPASAGSVAAPSAPDGDPVAVRLGQLIRRGRRLRVPVSVRTTGSFNAVDVELRYDASSLTLAGVRRVGGARRAFMATNTRQPGRVLLSLADGKPLRSGPLVVLQFEGETSRRPAISVVAATVGRN